MKLLFVNTVPNCRNYMKVIVKIIQKINNKIFGINASLGPFLKRPLLRESA